MQPYLEQAQGAGCDFVILCDELSLLFRTAGAMSAFATLFAGARTFYKGPLGIDVNVQEEDDVLAGLYSLCDFISVNAYLMPRMRAVPTITLYNPATGSTTDPIRTDAQVNKPARCELIGQSGFTVYVNNSSTGPASLIYVHWTADAEL